MRSVDLENMVVISVGVDALLSCVRNTEARWRVAVIAHAATIRRMLRAPLRATSIKSPRRVVPEIRRREGAHFC